ncbi:hypothetical protein V8G54_021624 [Vigna mungo]|uniref:Uncharacterized protein n=1 Tax=Vigna mungo TaxID=3915 RepID=A0AAQ3NGF9_VIGMU
MSPKVEFSAAHPKIGFCIWGNLHLRREKKENAARFASVEDDFANCAAHGSMKKTNLVGEDYGLGALHDGRRDCRADDEAFDLDDSCSRLGFRDLGEIATLMVVAMEVMYDGCHGSVAIGLVGLKVEKDGDVAVLKCHLNTTHLDWLPLMI